MSKLWRAALCTILPFLLTMSAAMVVSASSSNNAVTDWYKARLEQSASRIRHSLANTAFPKGAKDIVRFTKAKTEHAKGVIALAGTGSTKQAMHNIQVHNRHYISTLEQTKRLLLGGVGAEPFEQYIAQKKIETVSSIDDELQLYFERELAELGTPIK